MAVRVPNLEVITEEKKLERIIDDKTDNSYSNIEDMYTNENTTLSSIVNSTIYDLQALISQRQDRLSSVLYEHYQYNTSINRGKEFFFSITLILNFLLL